MNDRISMDVDIQFGELEESTPAVRMRPDRNKHYAVVPCHAPAANDLPIFIDVDVMRDIEKHALSNTRVELGGVLLGGQYQDEKGAPFVEITDSLRAEHYEATKGSFKFTHDTWEAITRQRDDFPDDLHMVGWYHTHPDWGVFLSGMDMFICDNFFNRPLDVALVVDPCRDDRGWFQWTGDPQQRVKRTGGFYLMGSRLRDAEIQFFAELLEGEKSMATDLRRSAIAGHVGQQPPPTVNITDGRGTLQMYVMMGMLTMQFFLLTLVAWYLLTNQSTSTETAKQISAEVISRQEEIRGQAQSDFLAEIIGGIDSNVGKNLIQKYEQVKAEGVAAQSDLNAQRAIADQSIREQERLAKSIENLKRDLESKETELAEMKEQSEEYGKSLVELNSEARPIWKDWKVWTGGAVLCILSALSGFAAASGKRRTDEDDSFDERGDGFQPLDPQDRGKDKESASASDSKAGIEFETGEK